jgi:AcrR family transcriptional regulator
VQTANRLTVKERVICKSGESNAGWISDDNDSQFSNLFASLALQVRLPMSHTTVSARETVSKTGNKNEKLGKAALKRQRIIEAAALVFRRRGYAQATLSEIAVEAGTQAGSLYYHFNSREELVEEVLMQSSRRLSEAVTTALATLPPEADAFDRFVTMVHTHVLIVLERDDFGIAYQKIHDQVTDEMRANISRAPRAFARLWTNVFMEAVKEGFIRADYDPRLTRMLVIGSISWMADWYKPDGPSGAEEIADAVIRLFFDGAAVDHAGAAERLGMSKRQRLREAALSTN